MLRPVVAGIDGSPESLAAAHRAAREALRRGTALTLLHAWRSPPRPDPSVPADMTRRSSAEDLLTGVSEGLRAAHPGLRVLERSAARTPVTALHAAAAEAVPLFPEVPVARTVVEGRAAGELVRACAGAALIVVGRRERETRFGTCLGSVAHAVPHHADRAVAVVPHA